MKKLGIIFCLILEATFLCSQNRERQQLSNMYQKYSVDSGELTMLRQGKKKAIRAMRNKFSEEIIKDKNTTALLAEIDSLRSDGSFTDIRETDIAKGDTVTNDSLLVKAFNRIWHISEAIRDNRWSLKYNEETWRRCQKAILRYGEIEIHRSNQSERLPALCTEMSEAAVNTYFCHVRLMEKAERDSLGDKQLQVTCEMLKMLAFRGWIQQKDNTLPDLRLLWKVAIMFYSDAMMDRVAELCRKTIDSVAQNECNKTSCPEGYTVDGLCWAFGRQAWTGERIIPKMIKAFEVMGKLKDTIWGGISREMAAVLMNYFRGSSFYYYKGYTVPCLGQNTMLYQPKRQFIDYAELLKILVMQWENAFTKVDYKELRQLYMEMQEFDLRMYRNPYYSGTRWFFNNDDLIKKTQRYHITVNMTSLRCDGPGSELAADTYNHFSADGATFFQKKGIEYQKAFGAYDITAFPGVTAHEGMKYIVPAVNRPGYCSKHNFAAGATSGGENAVAGFKYEKVLVSERGKKEIRIYREPEEIVLYGVKAYKSYFILGDYTIALGAGISNKVPKVRRRIRTTIEQTEHLDSVYLYKGNGVDWVVHKGQFAYSAFPQYSNNTFYVCESKKTNWTKMNPNNKQSPDSLPEKVNIFRMWIDHGHNPMNDTYGYVVYAGDGIPPKKYPFEVLRNDILIQAIKSIDSSVVGAMFYDAGASLRVADVSLMVSHPCAVLIEKSGGYLILSIADAQMDPDCKQMDVVWNGKTINLKMPEGKWSGQPLIYRRLLSEL